MRARRFGMFAALLGTLSLVCGTQAAFGAGDFRMMSTGGNAYRIEEDTVHFFQVTYSGSFSASEAEQAANWAAQRIKKGGGGSSQQRIDYRTASSRHIVVGWYYPKKGSIGWLAGTNGGKSGKRGVVKYISWKSRQIASSPAWVNIPDKVRGFRVELAVATDNDTSSVAACWNPPK